VHSAFTVLGTRHICFCSTPKDNHRQTSIGHHYNSQHNNLTWNTLVQYHTATTYMHMCSSARTSPPTRVIQRTSRMQSTHEALTHHGITPANKKGKQASMPIVRPLRISDYQLRSASSPHSPITTHQHRAESHIPTSSICPRHGIISVNDTILHSFQSPIFLLSPPR